MAIQIFFVPFVWFVDIFFIIHERHQKHESKSLYELLFFPVSVSFVWFVDIFVHERLKLKTGAVA